MIYLTSLSYIDLVPNVHFKTKHNYIQMNKHYMHFAFYAYLVFHANFSFINKYKLPYCILQHAHSGTWLILIKN